MRADRLVRELISATRVLAGRADIKVVFGGNVAVTTADGVVRYPEFDLNATLTHTQIALARAHVDMETGRLLYSDFTAFETAAEVWGKKSPTLALARVLEDLRLEARRLHDMPGAQANLNVRAQEDARLWRDNGQTGDEHVLTDILAVGRAHFFDTNTPDLRAHVENIPPGLVLSYADLSSRARHAPDTAAVMRLAAATWPPEQKEQEDPDAPSDGDADDKADAPSDGDADDKADAPSDGDADDKADAPSDGDADDKADAPSDGDADDKADAPSDGDADDKADAPSDGDADDKADAPSDGDADDKADAPSDGDADDKADAPSSATIEEQDEKTAADSLESDGALDDLPFSGNIDMLNVDEQSADDEAKAPPVLVPTPQSPPAEPLRALESILAPALVQGGDGTYGFLNPERAYAPRTPGDFFWKKGDLPNPVPLLRALSADVVTLRTQISRLVLAKIENGLERRQTSGRLDQRAFVSVVTRADPYAFQREVEAEGIDTAVAFLVDLSGSMFEKEKHIAARNAVLVLAEALEPLTGHGLSYAIEGFNCLESQADAKKLQGLRYFSTSYIASETVLEWTFKGWSEKLRTARPKIAALNLAVGGNNNDAPSVERACFRLLQRPEKRKILFVLSDGLPSCDAIMKKKTALDDALLAVVNRHKRAVEIIGVGLMNKEVGRFYPSSFVVDQPQDFARRMLEDLKEKLLNPRKR